MEENGNSTIIIDVQMNDDELARKLGEVNAAINTLKASNTALRQEIKAGNDEGGKNSRQLAEQEATLKQLTATQRALTGQVQQATKESRTYGDTIKEQSALLAEMKNRYQSLSKAERENEEVGGRLLKEIQALDAEIKRSDYSIGNFQRNVGNYPGGMANAMGQASQQFKSAVPAVGKFSDSLKMLIANPVGAVIAAIVVVVKALIDAFKSSETLTNQLKAALSALNPIIDFVKNAFSAFAGILVKVVSKAVDGITAGLQGLGRAIDWIGSKIGKDWHVADAFSSAASAARDLTKEEQELVNRTREWVRQRSDLELQISELRAKVAEKDKYTSKERLAMLDEAIAKEEQIAKVEKNLAQKRLELLEREAARTENDAAMNDKLAEAYKAVNDATKNFNDTTRRLRSQRAELVSQLSKETTSVEDLGIAYERTATAIEDFDRYANDTKDIFDQMATDENASTDAQVQAWKERLKAREYWNGVELEMQRDHVEQMRQTTAELVGNVADGLGSLSAIYKQIAADESKSEAERAQASAMAQRLAILQVAANGAIALSRSIAEAAAVPWPANIAAIATSVSTVLAVIAQAKGLLAQTQQFAKGGIVGGTSYTGDNVIARVNSREGIFTLDQQKRLFDIANGGAAASSANAIVEAIKAMPAPVLDYREFTDFTRKVNYMENGKRIK